MSPHPWGDAQQHAWPDPSHVGDPEYLREWLGVERLGVTPTQARLLFSESTTLEDLAAYRAEPTLYDDNELMAAIAAFHLGEFLPNNHPVLAHFLAHWWTWGHGYRLHWLKELHNVEPQSIIEVMRPFRATSVLMEEEDLRRFDDLPDSFTVWRGAAGPKERVAVGYCWTLGRDVAQFFADRNAAFGPPTVVSRRISKRQVIFADFSREAEVVVPPTKGAWTRYLAWLDAQGSSSDER